MSAVKKATASPTGPTRSLNPLPPDAVGGRLLVRLQAEHVMTKQKLKEAWEGPEGWRFEDVCAVSA